MPPVPLLSGSYSARGVVAGLQRCVNLYPEVNPQQVQAPAQVTHYPAPGLVWLGTSGESAGWRGFYTTTTGDLYGVCGTGLYYIDTLWRAVLIGRLGNLSTQVKFADNGTDMLVGDGSTHGYIVNLLTQTFSIASAGSNSGTNGFSFAGAGWVDFVDGFIVYNVPGTPNFACTGVDEMTFDPLSFGTKAGRRDNVQALVIRQRNVWLLGSQASELWTDAGTANFPFQLNTGPYVEHGIVGPYALAKAGEGFMMLSQNINGGAVAVFCQGYKCERVSTWAQENEWGTYGDLSGTVGFSFKQGNHEFVCLRFPSADKTWVWDLGTGEWHERTWNDDNGVEHQWRINCATLAYGKVIGGDWETGDFYEITTEALTNAGRPMVYRRGFPQLISNFNRTRHNHFRLDIEAGEVPEPAREDVELFYDDTTPGQLQTDSDENLVLDPRAPVYATPDNVVMLRWSDDRGKTWSNPVPMSFGEIGEFQEVLSWRQLGEGRARVYEIFWSSAKLTGLNQGFAELAPGRS